MIKKMANKLRVMLIGVMMIALVFGIGVFSAKAEDSFTGLDSITYEMEGASIRIGEEDGVNGLRFIAKMTKGDYALLMSNVGEDKMYTEIEFGVLIAPEYFTNHYPLNEATVFGVGGDKIYDWAVMGETGWVYEGTNSLPSAGGTGIRIINIYTNEWVEEKDGYTYSGAIVNILDDTLGGTNNLAVNMFSNAYIKATKADGTVEYKISSNSMSMSAAYAAQKAIEQGLVTKEQAQWLKENYVEKAFVNFNYVKTDDTVRLFNVTGESSFDILDAVKDCLAKEYINVNEVADFNITITDAYGTEKTLDAFSLDITDASNVRLWTLKITKGNFSYTVNFDLYSEEQGIFWNDLLNPASFNVLYGSGSKFATLEVVEKQSTIFDGVQAIELSNVKKHDGGQPGEVFIFLQPLHSKEYYQMFANTGAALNYSYYWSIDPTFNGGTQYILNQYGHYGKGSRPTGGKLGTDYVFNKWHNASISIDTLLANWTNIVDVIDATYSWGGSNTLAMAYALTEHWGSLGGMPGMGLKFYFAGFNFGLDSSAISYDVGDVLINVDEVRDLSKLDFTKYMTDAQANDINRVLLVNGITAELKGYSIESAYENINVKSFNATEVKRAAYKLIIKDATKGNTIYTAMVDLYSPEDEVVWAESMTAENVILRKTAYQVGWPSAVTGTLVAGTDYEFVDSLTVGSKTYPGSFFKVTVSEAMNIALDIKALHTKAYYQEMSDLTKVLHIRGFFPSSISMGATFSANNYGMNNTYSTWRNSTDGNTYESIVISMDNYLIASDNNTASGRHYNWANITGNNCSAGNTMLQFEIPASKATTDSPFIFYLGNLLIEDAGETLVNSASKYVNTSIDMTENSTFDLINIIPENQRAKYQAFVELCGTRAGKKSAYSMGFNLTINGTVHSIGPNEDGKILLNLFDYVRSKDGVVSTDTQVIDLLNEGENTVSIQGYLPPVISIGGYAGWPVDAFVTGTLTITAPGNKLFVAENGVITGLTVLGKSATTLEIPSELDGVAITGIGAGAINSSVATTITIPATIENIGVNAFNCPLLTEFIVDAENANFTVIDGNLYLIGGDTIVKYATAKEDTTFDIPKSVTTIGPYAFAGAKSLVNIIIYNSVETVSSNAFADCDNLTIFVEANSKPEGWVEDWNSSNLNVVWGYNTVGSEGLTFELVGDTYSVSGYTGADTTVIIPKYYNYKLVTAISAEAFANNTTITSIVLDERIEVIGSNAFNGCSNLVILVKSTKKLEGWAEDFAGNATVIYDAMGTLGTEGIVYTDNGDSYAVTGFEGQATELNIPAYYNMKPVTSISAGAIVSDTITKVIIPSTVATIDAEAFTLSVVTEYQVNDNANYSAIDGNLYNADGSELIKYAVGKTETYLIVAETVTTIGSYALVGTNFDFIYVEVAAKPEGFANDWAPEGTTVYYGLINGGNVLVDVNAIEGSYDLAASINKHANVVIAYYGGATYTVTDTVGNEVVGTSIDLTNDNNKTVYVLNAYVGEKNVYTVSVDLYDSADGLVWINVNEDMLDYVYTHTQGSWSNWSTRVEDITTVSGDWFVSTFPSRGSGKDNVMTVMPMHSKAYYERLAGLGANLTFYYYPSVAATTEHRYFGQSAYRANPEFPANSTEDKKVTINIAIDDILANWDEYTSGNPNTQDGRGSDYLIRDHGSVFSAYTGDCAYYLSGFDITLSSVTPVTKEGTELIDVKSISNFDLADLVNTEGKAELNKYTAFFFPEYTLTDNSGKTITFGADSEIDLTKDVSRGFYTLNVYIGEQLAYTTSLDFFSSEEAPVWLPVDEAYVSFIKTYHRNSCDSATNFAGTADYGTVSIGTIDGEDYYKIAFPTRGGGVGNYIYVLPLHGLAYYSMYGEGITLDSSLYIGSEDDKVLAEGETYTARWTDWHKFGGGNGSYRPQGQIQTTTATGRTAKQSLSFALSDFITHWDTYMACVPSSNIHSTSNSGYDHFVADCSTAWSSNVYPMNYYINGLDLVLDASSIEAVTDTTESLVDVNGKSTIDLTDYMTGEETVVSTYPGFVTYTLTDLGGNVKELGASPVLDVTNEANLRAWTISASLAGTTFYSGTLIDLYDSAKAPVWNTLDPSFMIIYSGINTVRKATPTLVETTKDEATISALKYSFTGGEHNYFVMRPIHTKEYYALYTAEGYTLSYSVSFDDGNPDTAVATANQFLALGSQRLTESQINESTGWYTLSATLTKFYDNWANYVEVQGSINANGTQSIAWGDRSKNGMFYLYSIKAPLDIYITGFELTKA